MSEVLPVFPSPIFKVDTNPEFKDIKSDLINFCYSEQERDPIGVNKSNYNSWHSITYTSQKRFEQYKNFINDNIKKIFNIHLSEQSDFKLEGAWININAKNSSNSLHNHPGCDLSGCLWIKSTENSGSIRFENPNYFSQFKLINHCNFETKNKISFSDFYWFKPIEGQMLLFPSEIRHCVFENKDDEDRISIAFNLNCYEK
jgi:uncharacterized protein (TIGR02466 family)